ncbi:MAG: acylphosphatase [Gemmatimonadetes bacterium]|nr:acylphosphatase [Gemmatimonadota bacterium]
MKRIDARITGRVQGVFFRASTERRARELGVRGTVRNEADGSVFLEAEGDPAAVDALVAWCRQGPPAADVRSVQVLEGPPAGFPDFRVTG